MAVAPSPGIANPESLSCTSSRNRSLATAHCPPRTDLICDRVRAINRLRATLLEYFLALERDFDYSKSRAALTLLSGNRNAR